MGIAGETEKVPPSMLYCTVNPGTAVTVGKLKAALHELAGAVIAGGAGKITTLTELLFAQAAVPAVVAGVAPHVEVSTYLAEML